MAFASLDQLRKVQLPLRKSVEAMLSEACATSKAQVFLSHSHLDDKDLARTIRLLEHAGATVRVDKSEKRMLGVSGGVVAPIVKNLVRSCPKMVVAMTQNIATSRWIPWEIGLADGLHGVNNVALFPLLETSVADVPVEKEYLSMYPTVEWEHLTGDYEGWVVKNPKNDRYWTLNQWVNQT